jgi:hypothetical protein
MSDVDYEHKFREIARLQHKELERLNIELAALRVENQRLVDWIMGEGPDALTALQKVYSDPKTSESNVIKSVAVHFERARPPSSSVAVVVDFREKVKTIRLAQLERDKARWAAEDAAKTIEGTVLGHDGEGEPPAA